MPADGMFFSPLKIATMTKNAESRAIRNAAHPANLLRATRRTMPRHMTPHLRTLRSGVVGETPAEFKVRQWKMIKELNYRRANDYFVHAQAAAVEGVEVEEPAFLPLPMRVPIEVLGDLANTMRPPLENLCDVAEYGKCECPNCAAYRAARDAGHDASDALPAPSVFIRAHDFRYRGSEEGGSFRWNPRCRVVAFSLEHVQLGEGHDHSDPRVNGALCFTCVHCARYFIYPATYKKLWLDYVLAFESTATVHALRAAWGDRIDKSG